MCSESRSRGSCRGRVGYRGRQQGCSRFRWPWLEVDGLEFGWCCRGLGLMVELESRLAFWRRSEFRLESEGMQLLTEEIAE